MLAECFTRDKRLKIIPGSIVILAIISQAIGWSFISGQYIYKKSNCTYYLSGTSSCPQSYSYYYSRNSSDDYYMCDYYDDACVKAQNIRSSFVGAILYPLIYMFYMCLFSGCYYCYFSRRYNFLRCSQIFWMICYFVCMILFFTNANYVNNFANSTRYDVNTSIKDACIGLGILCIFKLILLFGLSYDIHYYIRDQIIVIQQPVAIIQTQQPIIIQSGFYTQAPQVVYNGPQYIQQSSIIIPNNQPIYGQYQTGYGQFQQSGYGQYQQPGYGQQQPIYGQFQQPIYGQEQQVYGQPVYGQPVQGQPIKQ